MAAALALALVVGGCGADDGDEPAARSEEQAVRATIERLQQATRSRDAEQICEEIYARRAGVRRPRHGARGQRVASGLRASETDLVQADG